MNSKKLKKVLRATANGCFFVWPYLVGVIVFFAHPLLFSGWISFGDFSLARGGFKVDPAGFKHYYNAFVVDIEFTEALWGSAQETMLKTPLIVVFSLIMAILLNKKIPGQEIFRTIFFLPFLLARAR